MTLPLPPKRFEADSDTKYDAIRHKNWFRKLSDRRAKLHLLKLAAESMHGDELSQIAACESFGVDTREVRDYIGFINGTHKPDSRLKVFQLILDDAYFQYCEDHAEHSIRYWVELCARPYGINPRHAIELWEVDPTFWPTNYTK